MTTDRRTLLAGGATAALLAPVLTGIGGALAQTALAAAPTVRGVYRYKVGDIDVMAINDGVGSRKLDEGFVRNAPLADVQRALDAAFFPAGQIAITYTQLLVKNGQSLTLIDTGFGDNGAPTTGSLIPSLVAAGVDPAAVTTVLISHFHGDHISGVRLKAGALAFPNAEIMVPAPEWAYWMDDARMNNAPEGLKPGFANVRRVFTPIASQVKQFEHGREILPGIMSVDARGHTPGHTAFVIQSGQGRLLVTSDATNHPALNLRNADWRLIFDMDPEQAIASRRRLFDMAAADKLQVAGYHFPFPATGFVAKTATGYDFVPATWPQTI